MFSFRIRKQKKRVKRKNLHEDLIIMDSVAQVKHATLTPHWSELAEQEMSFHKSARKASSNPVHNFSIKLTRRKLLNKVHQKKLLNKVHHNLTYKTQLDTNTFLSTGLLGLLNSRAQIALDLGILTVY